MKRLAARTEVLEALSGFERVSYAVAAQINETHLGKRMSTLWGQSVSQPGLVHPEGRRNDSGDPDAFLSPKPGIGRIALRSRAPVVPIFVNGLAQGFGRLLRQRMTAGVEPVRVLVGPPSSSTTSTTAPMTPMLTGRRRSASRPLSPRGSNGTARSWGPEGGPTGQPHRDFHGSTLVTGHASVVPGGGITRVEQQTSAAAGQDRTGCRARYPSKTA